MRWTAFFRCPPILRGVSASQIRADRAIFGSLNEKAVYSSMSSFAFCIDILLFLAIS
jgi:hypothetical protein